jgi:hypothetical protein
MSRLVDVVLWLAAGTVVTIGVLSALNTADRVLWKYHTTSPYEARGYIHLCRSQGVAEIESHSDGTHTITCTKGIGE